MKECLAGVVGEREHRGFVVRAALAGDAQYRLAMVPVELLDLKAAYLADPEAVEAEQQHNRQGVGGVVPGGGDEALELGLGEGGALGAFRVDLQRLAVPARVTVDELEVERVQVEAADRGEAALERLGGERGSVGLVLGEVFGEVVAAHFPDVDGLAGAPDEEGGEVGGVCLARVRARELHEPGGGDVAVS